jgi:hypothetical protein
MVTYLFVPCVEAKTSLFCPWHVISGLPAFLTKAEPTQVVLGFLPYLQMFANDRLQRKPRQK